MLNMKIRPASSIRGKIELPGDKSMSHRAAFFAAMAEGESRILNYSTAADCSTTLACLATLGVDIRRYNSTVYIRGVGEKGFRKPDIPIDCGNSGTTVRLLAGILAGQKFESVLTGDESLLKRPMQRIIEPLYSMGAKIESDDGHAPIRIFGVPRLNGTDHKLTVASAQVKSCLLLAGLHATGSTTVLEPTPTRDHTERMLRWLGVEVDEMDTDDGKIISVLGDQIIRANDIEIPGDISSAAFFLIAAACLPESKLNLENVGLNPTRTAIINVLLHLGTDIETSDEKLVCNEPVGNLTVRGISNRSGNHTGNLLNGKEIANLIDELPILAILGTQINGGIEIRDATELRVKESDRISAIVENLKRMGANVTEFDDGFKVERSELNGAVVDSFGDHRISMAFAVAGLFARGETEILNSECVDISFPGFFEMLATVVR